MAFKLRKILKNSVLQKVFAALIYYYLWFVFKTSRFDFIGEHHYHALTRTQKAGIVAFFHGRLALMPFAWRQSSPFYMLLSDHSDGHFISRVIKHHGIDSIYGSTTRGGMEALMGLIRHLKKGCVVGITPDGPRGPCYSISKGTLHLAKLSGAPLIPSTYGIKRHKRLKTWDRFMVPLPFSRGVFIIGDPFKVEGPLKTDEDIANVQNQFQTIMLALQERADQYNA